MIQKPDDPAHRPIGEPGGVSSKKMMGPMSLHVGLAMALLLAAAAPSPAADEFVVIVHPSVVGTNVHRADLAAVFLRKAVRWGTGAPAVPVDQSGTSAVRNAFSQAVLGMPVATAVQYWQKQMFGTKPLRPPAVKASDAEVIAFVEKTEGAVGYVSKAATLPAGVKALAVTA
jgi:ABC-type phosphate transport system substrate-binding protein